MKKLMLAVLAAVSMAVDWGIEHNEGDFFS